MDTIRQLIEKYQHNESILVHEKEAYKKDTDTLLMQQKTLDQDRATLQKDIDTCTADIAAWSGLTKGDSWLSLILCGSFSLIDVGWSAAGTSSMRKAAFCAFLMHSLSLSNLSNPLPPNPAFALLECSVAAWD